MAVQSLQTVENAMNVMEAVAQHQPVGVSALARKMNMDKNTVQRILVTLGRQGWLTQDGPKGSWSLSAKVLSLSSKVSGPMLDRARPFMGALLSSTKESVTLWKLDGGHDNRVATLVEIIESPQALRVTVPLGTTFDLNVPPGSHFDVQPFLERFPNGRTAWGTPYVDRAPRYFAHDRSYPTAMSIGSVIFDGPGEPLGTLAVIGPKTRITEDRQQLIGDEIAAAARVLSGF
jgi:IclR family acetate operon transcriptional repressor